MSSGRPTSYHFIGFIIKSSLLNDYKSNHSNDLYRYFYFFCDIVDAASSYNELVINIH